MGGNQTIFCKNISREKTRSKSSISLQPLFMNVEAYLAFCYPLYNNKQWLKSRNKAKTHGRLLYSSDGALVAIGSYTHKVVFSGLSMIHPNKAMGYVYVSYLPSSTLLHLVWENQ